MLTFIDRFNSSAIAIYGVVLRSEAMKPKLDFVAVVTIFNCSFSSLFYSPFFPFFDDKCTVQYSIIRKPSWDGSI